MQVEQDRKIEQSRYIDVEDSDAYSLFMYAVRSSSGGSSSGGSSSGGSSSGGSSSGGSSPHYGGGLGTSQSGGKKINMRSP
jgi:hypothetical protein